MWPNDPLTIAMGTVFMIGVIALNLVIGWIDPEGRLPLPTIGI